MVRLPLRRAAGALAAVLGLVLVASCGEVNTAKSNNTTPIPAMDPFGGNFATEGTPKHGGTLLMGEDREVVSFDPTVQNTNPAALAVYDSLMKETPNGTYEPYLAQSMDTPDGGRTWKLQLRPGVNFSDGTPLDANAVIINVQRHIDKASSPAHTYAEQIASMHAVDPLTVEFSLKTPLGSFPADFGQSMFNGTLGMIISPAALQQYGKDIGSHPVGAGPFTFVSWQRDSKLDMAKNPNYWQQGKPYLDGLEFRPLPDTDTRYASIQNGDVDLIFGGYNDELTRAMNNPKLKIYYGPGDAGEWILFNFNQAPFNDRRMREAVVDAMNTGAMGASLYNGRLVPADSLFNSTSPYHTQAASDAWPKYDPEKAKQLVQQYQAGGGNPNFTFKTSNAPNRVKFGEFLQAQMAAVGIKVDLKFYDLAQFSSSVVQSNDFQATTYVGNFDTPYPAVTRLLHTGGTNNYGKYSNPKVDQLLDEAAGTTDKSVQTKDYQQVEQITGQDLVLGWFSRSNLSTITKQDVKGVDRTVSRDMYFATTWLDR
jgi:ABC-type transport system substrate-binding protein